MKREHVQTATDPYRPTLSSAAALIDATTEMHSRLARVAPYATPNARIRLMNELALIGEVLGSVEREIKLTAQLSLKAVGERRALPPASASPRKAKKAR